MDSVLYSKLSVLDCRHSLAPGFLEIGYLFRRVSGFEKMSLFVPYYFLAVALFFAMVKAALHESNLGTLMWVPQVEEIAERMLCNRVNICPDLNQYRALTSPLDF